MAQILREKLVRSNKIQVPGPSATTLNSILNYSKAVTANKVLDKKVLLNLN